jgi:hypothetical protein
MSRQSAQQLLVLALASSAGVHAGLAPTHAAETAVLGAMFALAALALAGAAVRVDRAPTAASLAAAGLLLAPLLAAYAATRLLALPPLTHAEPVDALGVITKLIEAAGLALALRLWQTHAGRTRQPPALREELAHE